MTNHSKDDPINTRPIGKTANGTGSSSDFTERPLYDISSSDLYSVRRWTIQEIQQLVQILFETLDRFGIILQPPFLPVFEDLYRFSFILRQIDFLGCR